jgi:uncharacterized Zn finger protein
MMKETVTAKAKRLLRERHDRIRIYESSDDAITGIVKGDSGMYQVTIVRHGPDNVTADCDCPYQGTCSHLLALEGYRMVRAGLARWEDLTG